jgi:basic amino acid/polyamine antiporter, APA family
MSEQPTLKRSMNLLTLSFYGLGTIIGAGIYVLIGEVAAVAGPYMPLSFLLAGLIALFTGLSYAELASRFPVSAGEAVYVKNAWNLNWLSGLVGWMIVLTGIVSAAAISNGFAGYLNVFIDIEAHWAIIILCLVLCGIAVYGINLSAYTVMNILLYRLCSNGCLYYKKVEAMISCGAFCLLLILMVY